MNVTEALVMWLRRFWTVSMCVIALILFLFFHEEVIACLILIREFVELSLQEWEREKNYDDII